MVTPLKRNYLIKGLSLLRLIINGLFFLIVKTFFNNSLKIIKRLHAIIILGYHLSKILNYSKMCFKDCRTKHKDARFCWNHGLDLEYLFLK